MLKEFCYVYGARVNNGLLLIAIVFNEKDLYKFSTVARKVIRGSKTLMLKSGSLPPLIELLRSNKDIRIYYKLVERAEYTLKESRACFYKFIMDMYERSLAQYILISSADGIIGEMYIPNGIILSSKVCFKSPYLISGYVIWTYYRRLLEDK
jgi:hypothetical protein